MYILILNNSYLKIIIIDNKKEIYKKKTVSSIEIFLFLLTGKLTRSIRLAATDGSVL